MGYGFKYHVVTIAAIFFALTVGLVVGSLLLSPKVAEQQTNQIKNLQKVVTAEFNANRAQKEAAEKELTVYVEAAIKGKLRNITVDIIQTGNYPDAVSQARDALEQAGAQIGSVVTIDHEMDRSDEALIPSLKELNTTDPRFPTDRITLAQTLASIIVNGDSVPFGLAPDLENKNYMHADPALQYRSGARYCVVVAGTQSDISNRVSNVDQPLIAALQKLNVTVLMCEPSDAHTSDVDTYRKQGIEVSTVDDIDEPAGRGSLIYAMGAELGSFGTKPTATALFPPELGRTTVH